MKAKTFRTAMIVIVAILILTTVFVLYSQSNLFNKISGTDFQMKFSYDAISDDADAGYLRLVRDDDTPLSYEWATFDNQEKFKYFSISPGQTNHDTIIINLPDMVEPDLYKINVEVNYNSGSEEIIQFDFLVI